MYDRAPSGLIFLLCDLKGAFNNTIIGSECFGISVRLTIQLHIPGKKTIQKIEDSRCIAVDERGRHADNLARCMGNLTHGIALPAVIIVLVQFIRDQSVDFTAHLFSDVGAQWIPPRGCGTLGNTAFVKFFQLFSHS